MSFFRRGCGYLACITTVFVLLGSSGLAQDFQVVIGDAGGDGINAWPGGEAPDQAINQVGQKYLNFLGDEAPTGIFVRPVAGPTVAESITLWTANDAEARDPASFQLFGSNSSEVLDPLLDYFPGDQISLSLFSEIAAGDLALPSSRQANGMNALDDANSQTISFANTEAYENYVVLFPTIKDAGATNSMQVGDIQLNYDGADITNGIFDPFDSVAGVALIDIDTGSPVGPQPAATLGNWSVREWRPATVFGAVDSIDKALEVIADESLATTKIVSDGMAEMINFADTSGGAGGGYSIPLPKQDLVGSKPGADDDVVMRAVAKVIIPEDGDYTFGFDGDDGVQLTVDGAEFTGAASNQAAIVVDGDTFSFPAPTGNALGLASTSLTAGEHDIELVWFERGGGAFVEVFAAPGVEDEFNANFSPVGLREAVPVASGNTATIDGEWSVRTVQVDTLAEGGFQITSLATAREAIDLSDDDERVFDSLDTEELTINYGGGTNGRFADDVPFEVSGDDFAVEAKATVVVPEDGDYIFGFGGDDGGRICVSGAEFTLLNERNGAQSVAGDGECVQWDGNTGNSDTYGTTFMAAGEYDVEVLWWERGGGDWLEVYTGLGTDSTGELTFQLLGDPTTAHDLTIPAGLQLAGEAPACDPNTGGDLNGDGDVGFPDFLILSANFGNEVADHTLGDVNCDGMVGFPDFLVLSANFGQTAGAAQSVPEPTGLALFGVVGLFVSTLRRRR